MTIQISNRRIIEFCDKHPSFDLESTVLSFIQFIEETNASTVPTLDSNLAYQIIENLKSLEQKVHGLDSAISMKHTEYLNKYIEDIKNIMTLNNTEKLQPIIKEYNEIFIDKITLLFKDIIPKEQQTQRDYLQSVIKSIEQIMIVEMNKGATKQSIDNIVSIIEQKFENVFSVISVNKQQESILNNKLDDIIDKFSKTSNKGRISENMLKFNLQAVYPTAEIKNVTGIPHSGDFWILRKDKPSILIENKNHDSTIQKDEVQKFIDNIDKRLLSEIRKNLSYNIEIEVDIFSKKVPINSSQLFSSYELFYDISISHPVLVLLFHRDKLYFDYCKKNSNFIFHSNRSIARTNLSQKTGTVENYESFNNDTLVGIRENLEYQAEAMIDRYIVAISDSDETIVSSIEYEKKNHVASQEKDKNNKSLWDRIF